MMRVNMIFFTILAATIIPTSITYGGINAFATTATFSPVPDAGSTVGNTVVGDNDTFRQFLMCMLDADGDQDISEEEITSVLEAGSDEPVIVEEGEIKDCFEPLYVIGTGITPTPSPSVSVDTTNAAGESAAEDTETEEDEENGETDDDDDD